MRLQEYLPLGHMRRAKAAPAAAAKNGTVAQATPAQRSIPEDTCVHSILTFARACHELSDADDC